MAINSLYSEYFQKSRVFLYPALEIRRGASATPIETYVAWEGVYKPSDRRLVCMYHLRDDKEYQVFEKTKLFGNPLFDTFMVSQEGMGLYVFDFSRYSSDWDKILDGQYSTMSEDMKYKIRSRFGDTPQYSYIESFLTPGKYYGIYADLLGVNIDLLKKTRELCPKPDMEKETLVVEIKSLDVRKPIS
jgi:hypothetical protein